MKVNTTTLWHLFTACLASLSSGLVIGSSNVPTEGGKICWEFLKFFDPNVESCLPIDDSLWHFILTTSCCFGAFCSTFLAGFLVSKYGRKNTLVYNNLLFIIGAFFSSLSAHPAMFGVGRMLSGVACGIAFVAVPIYINEVMPFKTNGVCTTFHHAAFALGVLFSSLFSIYGSAPPVWRLTYNIVLIPAIAQYILLQLKCVESPVHLISIGQPIEAGNVLQSIRGRYYDRGEFDEMLARQRIHTHTLAQPDRMMQGTRHSQANQQRRTQDSGVSSTITTTVSASMPSTTRTPETISAPTHLESGSTGNEGPFRTMSICKVFTENQIAKLLKKLIALNILQQLSGVNTIVFFYSTPTLIAQGIFDEGKAADLGFSLSILYFVTSVFSIVLSNRISKNTTLLMITSLGMFVFAVVTMTGFLTRMPLLAMMALYFYIVSYALSLTKSSDIIIAQEVPPYATVAVTTITSSVSWLVLTVMSQVFPLLLLAIQSQVFSIFTGIGMGLLILTYLGFFVRGSQC